GITAARDGGVVATSAVLWEGRPFRVDWASATDIGHRAAAANIADIAAMGAVATALLVAVCIPTDLEPRWLEQLADGLAAEAEAVGAAVVGGGMAAGRGMTSPGTAVGGPGGRGPRLPPRAPAGGVVAMAGRVGHAAAGYTVLSRGFRSPKALVDAYRRPVVPYRAGPAAAGLGATSMIDVSDGLLADVGHVAEASGVGIDIRRG